MILINFTHPLTTDQLSELAGLLGQPIDRVLAAPAQLEHGEPFAPQVAALVAQVGLTPNEWQVEPILVNLPSLSAIAALVLAELHGRMGYFPPVVRLRPVAGALPPRYEVAEMLNLQEVRDAARRRRTGTA